MSENTIEEQANASYKVNFSIPEKCKEYKIILETNIFTVEIKPALTLYSHLKNGVAEYIINDDDKKVTINKIFDKEESHIFNYILDKCNISEDILLETISKAFEYFDEYEVTRKTYVTIDKYINTLGSYKSTWFRLTNKPDYNLTLFNNRMLPYFNLECKDWVKANLDAIKEEYPTEIIKSNTDDYTDEILLATRNNNFLEYPILPIDKYPNMENMIKKITILYKIGLHKQCYMMIMRLMLSPKYCHVIKEKPVWDILKTAMKNKDFDELVRYCMFYALYILRQEETIMFSQVNNKYRVLFTLEQAVELPVFDTVHIERNPYIIQLTDNTPLGQTMPFYLYGKRRINCKKDFERRFDIATGGAFKGVDFKSLGAAVTGSILIPCVHKSPLEDGFKHVNWDRNRKDVTVPYPYMIDTPLRDEDIEFANYLEYYYPSYVSLSDKDYKQQVLGEDINKNIINKISQNDIYYESEETTGLLEATAVRESSEDLHITDTHVINETPDKEKIITETILSESKLLPKEETENKSYKRSIDYNQLADIDISITTRDLDIFKERALILYKAICQNCNHRGPVHIKEVITLASIKYKIYGPGVPRPMDIFRIPYDPAKMVKKFHVHAVKMYYNGSVILFRSCVSVLLSGVGENYKWFSCNKIPADVLLKYAQRGITIILNNKERDALSKYISESERWSPMLKELDIPSEKIYCVVTARHPFFRPGIYNCGIRLGLREFERDVNTVYANSLVITKNKSLFPYGEVQTHTNKKIITPDSRVINTILDYIESDGVEHDEEWDDSDE
jgi:hypothetical protein